MANSSSFVRRLFAALFLLSASRLQAAPPNVLIVFADDMGYSDLGCYGGEIETPVLDGLAAHGLRFTQFYNTARCWPSRAALLTGYYAQQVRRDTVPGVKSGNAGVRPEWAPLLPALLRPLGYRSYHSGKWHVDGLPVQSGFDRSYDLEDHNRHFAPHEHRLDDKPLPPVGKGSEYYTSTAIADYAIEFLREHAREHAGKPFFTYLAYTAPHFPLQAPAEDIAKYRERYRAGWDRLREERWARMQKMELVPGDLSLIEREVGPPYAFPKAIAQLGPDEVNRPLPWSELTPEQQAFQVDKMAIYAAMVDRMDRETGRVLEQIRTMGALENTLVLFCSDNGSSAEMMVRGDGHDPHAAHGSAATFLSLGPGWSSLANTPFRRHKTWVHEGGIATPLIVHWPAGFAGHGELRTAPGHLVDVLPTVLEAVGGRPPAPPSGAPVRPGLSLVPAFTAEAALQRPPLWWLHEGNKALRQGDWKIVALSSGQWELYNLATDRAEAKDLAKAMPEKVRAMAEQWQAEWGRIQADAQLRPAASEAR